ncbi:MAG: alpha/beta hydrolase [Ruminococcaceae bacterium]|nr:alpha/beta hydrolase [Oscillospiraceae bacterium]
MKHERIYLNPDDDRVYIDTYIANLGKCRDAMLVIPGGGYGSVCTDREGEPVALDFFAKGYNAFVLNYRVGREGDVFPKQLLDAAAAMIYIRKNAEKLCINPSRVFAVGFSAGGHLCGCLATMFDYNEVLEAYGDDYMLVRPTAAILSYPVTVLTDDTHINSFKNLLGRPSGEFTEDEISKFSLDRAATPDAAPMFLWHTAEDQLVPPVGTITFAHALAVLGVKYKLSMYPYGPHGLALANEVTRCGNPAMVQPLAATWTCEADEWMKTLPDYPENKK